jgi:hypothetical protein
VTSDKDLCVCSHTFAEHLFEYMWLHYRLQLLHVDFAIATFTSLGFFGVDCSRKATATCRLCRHQACGGQVGFRRRRLV